MMIDADAIRRRVEEIRARWRSNQCVNVDINTTSELLQVTSELTDTITALLAEREELQRKCVDLETEAHDSLGTAIEQRAERDTLRQHVERLRAVERAAAALLHHYGVVPPIDSETERHYWNDLRAALKDTAL